MSHPSSTKKSYLSVWQFALFGALFGMIFPIVSWLLCLQNDGLSVNFQNLIQVHRDNLVLYMTDLAPVVLGLCFAIIGKFMRSQLNYLASVAELERSLRDEDHNDEQKYSLRNIRVTYVRVFISAGFFMLLGLTVVILEQEEVRSSSDLHKQIAEFDRMQTYEYAGVPDSLLQYHNVTRDELIMNASRKGLNADDIGLDEENELSVLDFPQKLSISLAEHSLNDAKNASLMYAIATLLVISILVYTHFFIFAPNFILAQKAVLTNTISRNLIKQQAEELAIAQQEKQSNLTQLQLNLKAALEVDRSLDPPIPDEEKYLHGWFSVEKPLQILSGDFIWYLKIDETHSIWALGDSVGHGVGGHLQAKLYKRFLDEISTSIREPKAILLEMDRRVKRLNENGSEFSCEMIVISMNFKQRKGVYASAGISSCILHDEILELSNIKESIGNFREDHPLEEFSFDFDQGDFILACTDGMKHTFNAAGKRLGTKGLKELAMKSFDKNPGKFSRQFEEHFDAFRSGSVLNDDSTLLGISLRHTCPLAKKELRNDL